MGLSPGRNVFKKQTDVFTVAGAGVIANTMTVPLRDFTIAVSTTGTVTSWTVVLEGSLDGIVFTTVTTHTNLTGNGVSIFSGSNLTPCLYFRSRCVNLVLGLGTSITSTVLGVQ